jgi:hypothetical protein
VTVDAMTSLDALQPESISFEGVNKSARRNATRDARHTLTITAGSGSSIVP